MADTDDTDILSLNTLIERPRIRIDDATYDITSPGELSITASYRLKQLADKLSNLRNTKGLSDAQQKQLTQTLDALCAIVMEPVPADVRATLRDPQKLAVIEVFTLLLSEEKVRLAGATVQKMAAKYLGAKPSPDSSDIMAAAPTAG